MTAERVRGQSNIDRTADGGIECASALLHRGKRQALKRVLPEKNAIGAFGGIPGSYMPHWFACCNGLLAAMVLFLRLCIDCAVLLM